MIAMQQHGFRRNHSTESALLNFIKHFYETFNQKELGLAVFIDFSKAFDCLDHRILLSKMEGLGIRGNALKLMKSYITNRKQYVFYNNEYSNPITPQYGTPQGSILGPLIFLIYVNDIVNAARVLSLALYADDVNGYKSNKCFRTLLNEINNDLILINDWILCNGLSINILKICHMLINGEKINECYEIKIGNTVIPRVHDTKLLGLYVDEKLKWNVHIRYLTDKISKVCGVLYCIRKKLTAKAMRTIYLSLIYSHIIYCVPIWGNTWACHVRPVEIAQKRAIRTMNYMRRYDHTHEVFVTQKLLKFKYIYSYFSSLLIFKFLYSNYVPLVFSRANNPYGLRNSDNVSIPISRTELYSKSVYFSAPSIWYNLPNHLKQMQNVNAFKSNAKAYLLTLQTHI